METPQSSLFCAAAAHDGGPIKEEKGAEEAQRTITAAVDPFLVEALENPRHRLTGQKMVHRKMELKLIDNVGKRNTVYKKRIEGMKKKASELATLCAIPALLISFGPGGQVETWPENGQEVADIICSYNLINNEDKDKNKLSLEEFLESQIRKKKQRIINEDHSERKMWDMLLDGQSEEALKEQIRCLDMKMEEIKERMQFLSNQSCAELSVVAEEEKMLGEQNRPTLSENCSNKFGSGFGDGMSLSSAGLSDVFKTIEQMYGEESNYIGFENSWKNNVNYQDLVPTDDNRRVRYGSCNELMAAVNPFLPRADEHSNEYRDVGFGRPPVEQRINWNAALPQFEPANQQMAFTTTSLGTASPFGGSMGVTTSAQVVAGCYLQYPHEASIRYEEPSIDNLEIPDLPELPWDDDYETFDNHHFMAQKLYCTS